MKYLTLKNFSFNFFAPKNFCHKIKNFSQKFFSNFSFVASEKIFESFFLIFFYKKSRHSNVFETEACFSKNISLTFL